MKSLRNISKKFYLLLAVIICGSIALAPALSDAARAPGSWPTRPVNWIVGFAAGGGSDVVARTIGAAITDLSGMPISVTNIGGAASGIAGEVVLEAPADGYTLFGSLAHSPSSWAVNEYNNRFFTDFYFIPAIEGVFAILVANDSEWETIEQLIADVSASPVSYRWGSPGFGSIGHLAGELFVQAMGLDGVSHIGYSGGREAVVRLMAGDVDFKFGGFTDVADMIVAGDVRCLGIVAEQDKFIAAPTPYVAPSLINMFPQIAIAAELRSVWGVHFSRSTPPEVVKGIVEAIDLALQQDSVLKELVDVRAGNIVSARGIDSDILSARIESLMAWGLWDVGIATISPEEFGIPRIEDFSWPPHDRARDMNPWPN